MYHGFDTWKQYKAWYDDHFLGGFWIKKILLIYEA